MWARGGPQSFKPLKKVPISGTFSAENCLIGKWIFLGSPLDPPPQSLKSLFTRCLQICVHLHCCPLHLCHQILGSHFSHCMCTCHRKWFNGRKDIWAPVSLWSYVLHPLLQWEPPALVSQNGSLSGSELLNPCGQTAVHTLSPCNARNGEGWRRKRFLWQSGLWPLPVENWDVWHFVAGLFSFRSVSLRLQASESQASVMLSFLVLERFERKVPFCLPCWRGRPQGEKMIQVSVQLLFGNRKDSSSGWKWSLCLLSFCRLLHLCWSHLIGFMSVRRSWLLPKKVLKQQIFFLLCLSSNQKLRNILSQSRVFCLSERSQSQCQGGKGATPVRWHRQESGHAGFLFSNDDVKNREGAKPSSVVMEDLRRTTFVESNCFLSCSTFGPQYWLPPVLFCRRRTATWQ